LALRFDQLRPSTVDQSCASPALRFTPYAVPAGSTAIRSKFVSVQVTVAASDVPPSDAPASGGPASGVPASGVPASGVPASGVPASGTPASPPPPPPPAGTVAVSVKSLKRMPDIVAAIPAPPLPVYAAALESVALSFGAPFTDPVSVTGNAPCTLNEKLFHAPRSGIPLATLPSTVTAVPA